MIWGKHSKAVTREAVVLAWQNYAQKLNLIHELDIEPDEKSAAQDQARLRFLEIFTEYLKS